MTDLDALVAAAATDAAALMNSTGLLLNELAAEKQAAGAAAEAARVEAERVAALPGQVNFFRDASASFDVYTRAPDAEMQAWMRGHYHRMRVYSPYFDSRLEGETT